MKKIGTQAVGLCPAHMHTVCAYCDCPESLAAVIAYQLYPHWVQFQGAGDELLHLYEELEIKPKGCCVCALRPIDRPGAIHQIVLAFYHIINQLGPAESLDLTKQPVTVFHTAGVMMPFIALDVSQDAVDEFNGLFPPVGGWN